MMMEASPLHHLSFLFFSFFSFSFMNKQVITITNPTDVLALHAFHDYIIEGQFNYLHNWFGDDPCGDGWVGIVCSEIDETHTQHVIELHLMNQNLSGTLAPNLGNISQLLILDLMWNQIHGIIPPEIGKLQKLTSLLLTGNNLTGKLPEELGNLKNVNTLQFDQNHISGPVPKSFQKLKKLQHLDMNTNSLSGTIPSELGSLQNLLHILLDNNNLTGPLPSELSNLSTLKIIQLDNNQFTGSIPSSYSKSMKNLLKLSMKNCSLNGTLPDFSGLKKLAYFDVSHNYIEGTLPTESLSIHITTFDVSYNQISGNIPQSAFSSLPSLESMVLRNNKLNGTLPTSLVEGVRFSTPSQRLLLDIQHNQVTNNNLSALPGNVTLRLYGNPYCSGSNQNNPYCIPDSRGISSLPGVDIAPEISVLCDIKMCDYSKGEELNYALFELKVQCYCSVPISVQYQLKSPGFSYFPPYRLSFQTYLSSALSFAPYQLNISIWAWIPGPRLAMDLKLFPRFPVLQFNNSEVKYLYLIFANQKIPPNDSFGPYQLISFTLPHEAVRGSKRSFSYETIGRMVFGCAVFMVLLIGAIMAVFLRNRVQDFGTDLGKTPRTYESTKKVGVQDFTFEEMVAATDNFGNSMQIGQGKYGKVYKGVLSDGSVVAIKRAQQGSLMSVKEFYTKIECLSQVHHRNLVSILGYCIDEEEQILVYEYMSNGTLHDHLLCQEKLPLDFQMRIKIALGCAKGLLYLQAEVNPPIYHWDINTRNILLDKKRIAKVAYFGFSDSLFQPPHQVSCVLKGTPGYLNPDCFLKEHEMTNKSDAYSFGVVLLQLMIGLKPITTATNIINEVNIAYENGMIHSIADTSMGIYSSEAFESLIILAISCCKDKEPSPSMATIVRKLEHIFKSVFPPKSVSFNETSIGDKLPAENCLHIS